MLRKVLVATGLFLAAATPSWSQQVAVSALAAPDAFSLAGRDTGLPQTLWRGASPDLVRRVMPMLAAKPLSLAAAHLARRIVATGAPGPEGVGSDPVLIGQRATALIALADPVAAQRILERAPGVERSAELSRGAAELALLAGDDARACAVADNLGTGRDAIYWLRLRAYCQAAAGQTAQAQLTLDLAQTQARDPIYGRLMAAKLGAGPAGAASLRNGLDYALSRSLKLDLKAAKPDPAVAAAIAGTEPVAPAWDLTALDAAYGGLPSLVASGGPLPPEAVAALVAAAAEGEAARKPRLEAAALLISALTPNLSAADRARLAGFATSGGRSPAGRNLAIQEATQARAAGEVALLSLWTAAEAGPAGLAIGDRVRIVRSLSRVGLEADARRIALEGLAALK